MRKMSYSEYRSKYVTALEKLEDVTKRFKIHKANLVAWQTRLSQEESNLSETRRKQIKDKLEFFEIWLKEIEEKIVIYSISWSYRV